MSLGGLDPAILQDFLTESGELLEQLDQDLVVLEETPSDPEMLNQVFRALHTIKGSASFLELTNLVAIAHATESALNAARNNVVTLGKGEMDLLLEAVDVLKVQFEELGGGHTDLTAAAPVLVETLTAIGEGKAIGDVRETGESSVESSELLESSDGPTVDGPTVQPLALSANKADLIDFLVVDLEETIEHVSQQCDALLEDATRDHAADLLLTSIEDLEKSAEFFEIEPMHQVANLLRLAIEGSQTTSERGMQQLKERLALIVAMLKSQADGISNKQVVTHDLTVITGELTTLARGEMLGETNVPSDTTTGGASSGCVETPLELGPGKIELAEFFIADVKDSVESIAELLKEAADVADADLVGPAIAEQVEALRRTADFFAIASMVGAVDIIGNVATQLESLTGHHRHDAMLCANAAVRILELTHEGLVAGVVRQIQIDPLHECVQSVLRQDPTFALPHSDGSAQGLLQACGVLEASTAEIDTPQETEGVLETIESCVAELVAQTNKTPESPSNDTAVETGATESMSVKPVAKSEPAPKAQALEQTIRVEVGRLESLLNLVGELVLQKNRVSALARTVVTNQSVEAELCEQITQASTVLHTITSDIQAAVMRTRMQPLDKIFGKYPRLIRDLARKTGKKINLVIEGGDTEVDKTVIESLGDPLVHLLRNSADHGLEMPDVRIASGKDAMGTITLRASHEGNNVCVVISDDGKGLSREKIAAKAIEKGIATADEIAQLSDREVHRFIMAAGFSTADQVSDLSGRGVGMDVVKTNIEKLKGSIQIESEEGQGTSLIVTIPLTVAIMTAMMVRVEDETYAIPLSNVVEIVKPSPEELSTVRSNPVLRLRDTVLPLVDARVVFDVPRAQDRIMGPCIGGQHDEKTPPFAVVLQSGEQRIGLLVSNLIGQQEIVIKPLDEMVDRGGSVSGATVMEDGNVSLIVDVSKLVRSAAENDTANREPAFAH